MILFPPVLSYLQSETFDHTVSRCPESNFYFKKITFKKLKEEVKVKEDEIEAIHQSCTEVTSGELSEELAKNINILSNKMLELRNQVDSLLENYEDSLRNWNEYQGIIKI